MTTMGDNILDTALSKVGTKTKILQQCSSIIVKTKYVYLKSPMNDIII